MKYMKRTVGVMPLILVVLTLVGCAWKTPVPTPTATPLPTETATEVVATDTPQPIETPSLLPTETLPATATPVVLPTDTPQSTATLSPLPTDTLQPTETPSLLPTETLQPTATPSPLPTMSTEQWAMELASRVMADRLMADVRWLSDDARRGRLAGSPEEDVVGAWLVQWFQNLGFQPFADAGLDSYYLRFTVPAVTRYGRAAPGDTAPAENIIAVLPGTVRSNHYVGIGAHYDHIGVQADGQVNNGADDDATGVAAVLEVARILSAANLQPQETIILACFSGEEVGVLGSLALCDQLVAKELTGRIVLLNMEVLGAEKGKGTFLDVWDEAVTTTEPLVDAVLRAGNQLGVRIERRGRDPGSDAVRLVGCGVPAVSVDVAWSLENHPHYHRPSDDPEHIDENGFTNAVRVAVAALWLLANE